MIFQLFKSELEKINKRICQLHTDEQYPIGDGPVDPQTYFESKIKILWLLKESYDTENDGAGGWSQAELLGSQDVYKTFLRPTKSKNTWHPIIYISFGILNDFKPYDDIDFIEENPKIVSILKSISFININKLAGKSISNMSTLKDIFLLNKGILEEQINLLNPDIIIGGNTLKFYKEMLGLSTPSKSDIGTNYYLNNHKLYIDAYHPGQIGIKRYKSANEVYIDDIISIAKKSFSYYK